MVVFLVIMLVLVPTYWGIVLTRLLMGDYKEFNETKIDLLKDLFPFRLLYRYCIKEFKKL